MSIPLIHWMNIQPRKEFETVLSETEQSEFLLIESPRGRKFDECFDWKLFITWIQCVVVLHQWRTLVNWMISSWFIHDGKTIANQTLSLFLQLNVNHFTKSVWLGFFCFRKLKSIFSIFSQPSPNKECESVVFVNHTVFSTSNGLKNRKKSFSWFHYRNMRDEMEWHISIKFQIEIK